MEELGRLRRVESCNLMAQYKTSPKTLSSRTTTPKAALQEDVSSDVAMLLSSIKRKQALQTQLDKALTELHDVQAENKRLTSEIQSHQSSTSQLKIALDEAKHEQDHSTQLDKALAELQAENKRLTSENEFQQRLISHLKIAFEEQDNSLVRVVNELRVATSSLTLLDKEKKGLQHKFDSMQHKLNAAERQVRCFDQLLNKEKEGWQGKFDSLQHKLNAAERQVRCLDQLLNKEKEGWQDKFDSLQHKLNAAERQVQLKCMDHILNKEEEGLQDKFDSLQHKLIAAERQVRCLDHLTRQKLESRQEAGYGQPTRRGMTVSIPASTDVIEAMRTLNEDIHKTCVQLVEGLERTAVCSTEQNLKPQVQMVLGDHLTAMIGDQAKKTTFGYDTLLMQTVLEVFMTHWCSSIIEAFYPQQESFADLLVRLSAQTTETSGT
jgi:chromosome segregation ATPase